LKRKKPAKIFTVSMGDMFDFTIPDLWRDLVFRVMFEARQHTFMVLTKQPQNVNLNDEELVPSNLWVGVSQDGRTTCIDDIYELEENAQVPLNFMSCEPLIGPVELPDCTTIKWVIIGAQTGARAQQPRKEWIQHLGNWAIDHDIPIFIKDNVKMSEDERLQEWPEVLA
jgi:protein gp37